MSDGLPASRCVPLSAMSWSWLAVVALFWAAVIANLPASKAAPALVATNRFTFSSDNNAPESQYWRYTGRRPAEGEVLRVAFRQANRWPGNTMTVVEGLLGEPVSPTAGAPSAGETRPNPAEVHFTYGGLFSKGYFASDHIDVEPWPEGRELWIGFKSRKQIDLWLEFGDPGVGGLDTSMSYAKTPRHPGLVKSKAPVASSISAVPVKVGTAVPSLGQPFATMGMFAALALLPALFLRGRRLWWVFAALLQAVLMVKAMELLFPSQWLWGGFHQLRLGGWWFWVGLGILQIATTPGLGAKANQALRGMKRRSWKVYRPGLPMWGCVLMAIVATSPFWYGLEIHGAKPWVKSTYGDAYGSLAIPGYDYHNPFATGLYHAWKDGLEAWLTARGEAMNITYAQINLVQRFTSMWLPLFLLLAGLVAREIGRTRRERAMIFGILLFSKTTIAFLGYVEVYGPALTVQAALVLLLLRAYRRGGVLPATAFSFFGYLFQMGGAMVLPAIAALWVRDFRRTEQRGRWLATRLAATVVLALLLWVNCLAVLYLFKHDTSWESFSRQVPAKEITWGGEKLKLHGVPMLYGSTGLPKSQVFLHRKEMHVSHNYLLASKEHASQLLGEFLFVAGPVLPLLMLAMVAVRGRANRDAARWGLTLASLTFLLSAVLLATSFPYPKDWDVFALHALWWTVALLWLLARGGALAAPAVRWVLLAVLLYAIWDTLPWVYYNLTWGLPPEERRHVFF